MPSLVMALALVVGPQADRNALATLLNVAIAIFQLIVITIISSVVQTVMKEEI